jgi:hypothetical protein
MYLHNRRLPHRQKGQPLLQCPAGGIVYVKST